MKKLLVLLILFSTFSSFAQYGHVELVENVDEIDGNKKQYSKVFNDEKQIYNFMTVGFIEKCVFVECVVSKNRKTNKKDSIYCFTVFGGDLFRSSKIFYSKTDILKITKVLIEMKCAYGKEEIVEKRISNTSFMYYKEAGGYFYYPEYGNRGYYVSMTLKEIISLYAILKLNCDL